LFIPLKKLVGLGWGFAIIIIVGQDPLSATRNINFCDVNKNIHSFILSIHQKFV
jgi:hypothetical protein